MDPDTEIQIDFPPLLRLYKSGRVERLMGAAIIPTSFDPVTGVNSKDVTIDTDTGISARLYLPYSPNRKLPILVYYHGGGFCIESAFSPTYQPFLNSLASKANLLVISVNYRLAPEHPLPAAYDDSWAALKWALSPRADPWLTEHRDFDRVFIAGDSAGANIAHQMALRAGEEGNEDVKIEGMALVHPFFWGTEPIELETREPKLRAWIEALWRLVNKDGIEVDDPWLNVTAKDAVQRLAGLRCRRVVVAVAEKDGLVVRGRAYCEAVKGSGWGGEVELVESKGEEHVFHLRNPECGKALELMEKLVAFFKNHE